MRQLCLQCLGSSQPSIQYNTWQCPLLSVVLEVSYKARLGEIVGSCISSKKPIKGTSLRQIKFLEGRKEDNSSQVKGVIWFVLKANQWFFKKKGNIIKLFSDQICPKPLTAAVHQMSEFQEIVVSDGVEDSSEDSSEWLADMEAKYRRINSRIERVCRKNKNRFHGKVHGKTLERWSYCILKHVFREYSLVHNRR